jgi:hypothetical protein
MGLSPAAENELDQMVIADESELGIRVTVGVARVERGTMVLWPGVGAIEGAMVGQVSCVGMEGALLGQVPST